MEIITALLKIDWFGVLGALGALLSAAIALATLIPGDEPERTLQKIVDFVSRFSRK